MTSNITKVLPSKHSSHNTPDFSSAIKLNPMIPDIFSAINPSNESSLELENQLLQNQIKSLSHTLLQYQFTNQKVLETLHENIMLRDNITTLELKISCLSEAIEIQNLEIVRRDNMITEYNKDLENNRKRIDIMSDIMEDNGAPLCKSCYRHAPVVTECKSHGESAKVVGCVYCSAGKCKSCKKKDVEYRFVLEESKKIKKAAKVEGQDKSKKRS